MALSISTAGTLHEATQKLSSLQRQTGWKSPPPLAVRSKNSIGKQTEESLRTSLERGVNTRGARHDETHSSGAYAWPEVCNGQGRSCSGQPGEEARLFLVLRYPSTASR